ncbi:MAG: Ni/Fe hydrogenase subunit alpha [Ignavibacteria bacterium]|nr:Ni/Fe hydrogenase subunit alpha [Ignavibacteria bacterium]
MKSKTIKVDYLARVEGEGSLVVNIKGNKIKDLKFKIFEPPRFFEAFLVGRHFTEVPDITARICGICPIAYQMSSVHAMESIAGIKIEGPIRDLRRLIYCGEWIESHVLHIYFLHAPDFLGYEDAIQIAKDHPNIVKKALEMKKIGNEIVNLLGGREIHPINVRVGGFYSIPPKSEFLLLIERLKWARDAAVETVRWAASLPFPDFDVDYEFVALSHPDEYPFNEGRLISNKGLNIDISDYENNFFEEHVAYANALHSVNRKGEPYFVGPLARFNLNFDKLSPLAKELAHEVGFIPPVTNPFKSIIARAIETVYACDEAIRLIENIDWSTKPYVEFEMKEGVGYGCTEAPRGILYHRYRVGKNGLVESAKIVPPTSQNQKQIEKDLYEFVTKYINLSKDELQWKLEQVIRNYDPCISCATHFLKLEIIRED